MFSNRLTFAALAVACITAAGAGGYFASRQNTVPVPVAAEQPLAVSDAPLVDTPVQETETVVDDRDNLVSRATAKPGPAAAATVPQRPVRPTPAAAPRSTPTPVRPDPPALDRSWPTKTRLPSRR